MYICQNTDTTSDFPAIDIPNSRWYIFSPQLKDLLRTFDGLWADFEFRYSSFLSLFFMGKYC